MHSPAESPLWASLLPACVAIYATEQFTHSPALHPHERLAIRNAVPKRIEEFAAGRACAHRALAQLGCHPAPLPRSPNRSPAWPQNITGSITHTDNHCAAAVSWRHHITAIGIDVETITNMDDTLHLICTPAERAALNSAETATIIFSAKEAIYKCQSTAGGTLPDFHDLELKLHDGKFYAEPRRGFTPAHPLQGRYLIHAGKVFTAITFPAR